MGYTMWDLVVLAHRWHKVITSPSLWHSSLAAYGAADATDANTMRARAAATAIPDRLIPAICNRNETPVSLFPEAGTRFRTDIHEARLTSLGTQLVECKRRVAFSTRYDTTTRYSLECCMAARR